MATRSDALTHGGDRWIRWTTTVSVLLLAVIAAVVSYRHMHTLAVTHGESAWAAALLPLSVDGMIVASSMTLLADSRAGRSGGGLPWVLLAVGSAASLAANVAVAEPTAYGRLIAAWPSFALIGAYELLMRQIRTAADSRDSSLGVRSAGQPIAAGRPQVAGPAAPARPRRGPSRSVSTEMLARARQVDLESWTRHGRPASAENLRVRLRVGAAAARAMKDALRAETVATSRSA